MWSLVPALDRNLSLFSGILLCIIKTRRPSYFLLIRNSIQLLKKGLHLLDRCWTLYGFCCYLSMGKFIVTPANSLGDNMLLSTFRLFCRDFLYALYSQKLESNLVKMRSLCLTIFGVIGSFESDGLWFIHMQLIRLCGNSSNFHPFGNKLDQNVCGNKILVKFDIQPGRTNRTRVMSLNYVKLTRPWNNS